VRTLSHVFFLDPSPVRRVPIQTGTAKAKFCFCKNNKRMIIILSRGGPESRTFPSKVTRGLHPAPSLTKPMRIQGHLSRGGPELRAFPSRVTRGLHPALA
jgi:hypothetical protein